MRSNLATIEQAFEHAATTDLAPTSIARTRIAGFIVPDPASRDTRTAQRNERIAQYKRDRDHLVSTLAGMQITPLATLPLTAWDRLCREAGLYQLTPDISGKVLVSLGKLNRFEAVALGLSIWFWLMLVAIITTGPVLVGIANPAPYIPIVGLCCLAFGGLILGLAMEGVPYVRMHRQFTRLCAWAYGKLPWLMRLRSLMPDGKSLDGYRDSRKEFATLVLPEPPADVANLLLRLRHFSNHGPLHVAAEPDAFCFVETLPQLYRPALDRSAAEREWRVRAALSDPIIYLKQGRAVAIVAQFGDFPIEQAMVERVATTENLF